MLSSEKVEFRSKFYIIFKINDQKIAGTIKLLISHT